MADHFEITGKITPDVAGGQKIEAKSRPTKRDLRRELVAAAQKQKRALQRGLTKTSQEFGARAKIILTELPDAVFEKMPLGIGRRIKSGIEIGEEHAKRQEAGITVLEEYLGIYNQESGIFTGGVEAKAEEILERNQATIEYFNQTGELGYKEFGGAVTRLFDLKDGIHDDLKKTDGSFRKVNSQGRSYVNLVKLETKTKRLDWIADTFKVDKTRAELLWNQAQDAKHAALPAGTTREQAWERLIGGWNNEGINRSEQIVILGLMQTTEAQGMQNFLTEGRVVDGSGRQIEAFSLGGDKLKKIETQYYEITLGFLSSLSSRGEHLLYDPGRGILVANISLRDRTVLRDALDIAMSDKIDSAVDNAPITAPLRHQELFRFFLKERVPIIKGKANPWDEMVARAQFETAYHERFNGQVNVSERFTQARHDKAAFDEVASAEIIKEHWFGRITGFKEAVAKYTLAEGPDKDAYDRLLNATRVSGDQATVKKLEDADKYAQQFLEMCAAPVGGLRKNKHHTFTQVFDPTVSSRSGPIRERIEGPDTTDFRKLVTDGITDRKYKHHMRMNENTGKQEVVFSIPGIDGEIIVEYKGGKLPNLLTKGGGELFLYVYTNGYYKEKGYWPEWENTVGSGFSAYLVDGIEHATNLLSRTNLGMYQKREIGRRLNELYDGSERHKRYFIQFLLGRRELLKGAGWEQDFQRQTGTPFNPLDNSHIVWLAEKLGLNSEQPASELVNKIADPETWKLYFDPLNENQMKRMYSDKSKLGLDRFFLNVLWAFDATTQLRENSNTLIEMGIHGIHYENGLWTGLTAEKLEEYVGKWKHCKPWEAMEVLGQLSQRVNEAQTEELLRAIRSRDNSVSHKMLGELFRHDLWRVAQLTLQEKEIAINEGRFMGEVIRPLTAEEIDRDETILGRAMEMKGYRMQLNLRAALDQMLFLDLVIQPGVSLNSIYEKFIAQNMFEYCLPLLTRGDIERINENPGLYPYLPLDDPDSYRLIDARDPRHRAMRDRILGALYVSSSMAQEDAFKLMGINARKIAWNEHSAAGNQGLWLSRVLELWGINNVMPINDQLSSIYESLKDVDWTLLDGEYAFLPDAVVRFAKEFYDVDITSQEEVERLGGDVFLKQFQEAIQDRHSLMFIMFGARMTQPHLLPAKYEVYYKQTINGVRALVAGDPNDPKSPIVATPDWFSDIPVVRVKQRDGTYKEIAVTYDMAVKHIKSKWLREPVYGPWPDLPVPHIEVDKVAVRAASFLNTDRFMGEQMIDIVNWMEELGKLPANSIAVSETWRTQFMPQLERYALNYLRTVNVSGDNVSLNALNIRKYMPEVIQDFKSKLITDGKYNLDFIREYFVVMYGLDAGGAKHTGSLQGIKDQLNILYGDVNFSGYKAMLGEQIRNLRDKDFYKFDYLPTANRVVASLYLYQMLDRLQFGVEGPSTLYKLIKIAQDRNYGYYFQRIFEKRTRYLGMSDEEKFGYFQKLEDLADFEVVELNEPKGKEYVKAALESLKNLGFENEDELTLFIGAIKGYGLEELHTVLFSSNPTELQPLFEKGLIKMTDAKGKALSGIEASKTILKEKENQHWHFQAYQPLIGPVDFALVIGVALGLKFLEPVLKAVQKTPLTPKVGSLYLLAGMGPLFTVAGAVAAAVSTGGVAGIAGIAQAVGQFPTHLFSAEAFGGLGSAYMLAGVLHSLYIGLVSYPARKKAGKFAATLSEYFGKIYSKQGAYF